MYLRLGPKETKHQISIDGMVKSKTKPLDITMMGEFANFLNSSYSVARLFLLKTSLFLVPHNHAIKQVIYMDGNHKK